MESWMTTEEKLREMKIHEHIYLNDETRILRVYKGWIYTFTKRIFCNGIGDQVVMSSVFVPK